jgi:hypothetical protein
VFIVLKDTLRYNLNDDFCIERPTVSLFDKTHLVAQADALPGRNTPMPVATLHAVNGHSMTNVPAGMEVALFAMGCFWGVERLFWQLPGFTAPPQAIPAAIRQIRPIAKCAAARPVTRKQCAWFTIRR